MTAHLKRRGTLGQGKSHKVVIMAKEKNTTLTEDAETLIQKLEQAKRYFQEGHEQQAMKELFEWLEKWKHTNIGETIDNIMSDKRRPRSPAFDKSSIVLAAVFLEGPLFALFAAPRSKAAGSAPVCRHLAACPRWTQSGHSYRLIR